MATLIYSMLTPLEAYVEGENGRFGWGDICYCASSLPSAAAWLQESLAGRSGEHLNRAHHAQIFVLQDVAVIEECSYCIGIAEIHS